MLKIRFDWILRNVLIVLLAFSQIVYFIISLILTFKITFNYLLKTIKKFIELILW